MQNQESKSTATSQISGNSRTFDLQEMEDDAMSTTATTISAPTSTMTASAPEFIPKRSLSTASSTISNLPQSVGRKRQPLANPSMIPQQPRIPKTAAEKETTRRLYIVLSQACLETYQVSGGGASGAARRDGRFEPGREERYTLLNCDDHVSLAYDGSRQESPTRETD